MQYLPLRRVGDLASGVAVGVLPQPPDFRAPCSLLLALAVAPGSAVGPYAHVNGC